MAKGFGGLWMGRDCESACWVRGEGDAKGLVTVVCGRVLGGGGQSAI